MYHHSEMKLKQYAVANKAGYTIRLNCMVSQKMTNDVSEAVEHISRIPFHRISSPHILKQAS